MTSVVGVVGSGWVGVTVLFGSWGKNLHSAKWERERRTGLCVSRTSHLVWVYLETSEALRFGRASTLHTLISTPRVWGLHFFFKRKGTAYWYSERREPDKQKN
jgi:hypothetical protein